MSGIIRHTLRTQRFKNDEMTQAELGRRIGLTWETIAAIEAGKSCAASATIGSPTTVAEDSRSLAAFPIADAFRGR